MLCSSLFMYLLVLCLPLCLPFTLDFFCLFYPLSLPLSVFIIHSLFPSILFPSFSSPFPHRSLCSLVLSICFRVLSEVSPGTVCLCVYCIQLRMNQRWLLPCHLTLYSVPQVLCLWVIKYISVDELNFS